MKKIYKYELTKESCQTVRLPFGYQILSTLEQDGKLCIWAMVDPENKNTTPVDINVYYTGEPITDMNNKTFLGTIISSNSLVYHIFYK